MKFTLDTHYSDKVTYRPVLLSALNMISVAMADSIVTDKGHASKSTGHTIIEFWIGQRLVAPNGEAAVPEHPREHSPDEAEEATSQTKCKAEEMDTNFINNAFPTGLSDLELSCMQNLWTNVPPLVHEIVMDRAAEGLPQIYEKVFGKTELDKVDRDSLALFSKQVCKMCEELVHENLLPDKVTSQMNERCKQWLFQRVTQLVKDEIAVQISNLRPSSVATSRSSDG